MCKKVGEEMINTAYYSLLLQKFIQKEEQADLGSNRSKTNELRKSRGGEPEWLRNQNH